MFANGEPKPKPSNHMLSNHNTNSWSKSGAQDGTPKGIMLHPNVVFYIPRNLKFHHMSGAFKKDNNICMYSYHHKYPTNLATNKLIYILKYI